jgi:hypothetical protein
MEASSAAGAANINYVNRLDRPSAGTGDCERTDSALRLSGCQRRGKTDRESLAAEFQHSDGPSSLRATASVLHNRLNLYSNFTYFLDDPDDGDQFEQAEDRIAVGGRMAYRRGRNLRSQRQARWRIRLVAPRLAAKMVIAPKLEA